MGYRALILDGRNFRSSQVPCGGGRSKELSRTAALCLEATDPRRISVEVVDILYR